MGVDVKAYAVIGCKLSGYENVPQKHTEHQYPEGSKFCPTCGEKLNKTLKTYTFDPGAEQYPELDKYGLDVIWGTDEEHCYVGLISNSDDLSQKSLHPGIIEVLQANIKEVLNAKGLTYEKFGLHAVLQYT